MVAFESKRHIGAPILFCDNRGSFLEAEMTPKQFFVVFDIPERWFFKSKKKETWMNLLKQFQQWPLNRVQEVLETVKEKQGASQWYYVEVVRRQLMLQEHESFKRIQMPKVMKDILKEVVK